MAQRWTRIWEGSGASTLAERMVCPLWAAVLGNGTQVDADNRMFTNPLTGEPDAGNPHVRFGGRGKVNPLSLPYRSAPLRGAAVQPAPTIRKLLLRIALWVHFAHPCDLPTIGVRDLPISD